MGGGVYAVLDSALSDTAATGLILGGGALGCAILVLGLTVMAIRRGAKAEALDRRRGQQAKAAARTARRAGSTSTATPPASSAADTDVDDPGPHDPYPRQPYSAQEPRSHQPYSRPYRVPKQEAPHAATNGHRPPPADES